MPNFDKPHYKTLTSLAFISLHTHDRLLKRVQQVALLKRLQKLGVNGNIIHLINSLLKELPQIVLANGKFSEGIVLTGAPQECVLLPILF